MKKQVIAYLHSHWDREWYREFEVFRIRLLRVFDNVLELLVNNKIPSFYFDGQTSALQDYLEIRPENMDLVKDLIAKKKLFIGPFYCSIDEFLTDKSVFRKNLEIGLDYSRKMGCEDFLGYLPDTFGHSKNVVKILEEFDIDKAVVWRGCGEIPSEFLWNGLKTVNLVRGYFMDVFSTPFDICKKAELIKNNLDKIAESSGNVLLLPIGGDHLGLEMDVHTQIRLINSKLDDYQIKLGSIFDYFELVKDNFKFIHDEELRDNSKTFILSGAFSSRLDLKKFNIECTHKLALVEKCQKHFGLNYSDLIQYAYKLLLQNQAHDGIYGCSVDWVHRENTVRYQKILQIANTILDELRFKLGDTFVVNMGEADFSGIVEFDSVEELLDLQMISSKKGFDNNLLQDIQKIPVTEDFKPIYTYLAEVNDLKPKELTFFNPVSTESDLVVDDNSISNSEISLKVIGNNILINEEITLEFVDFVDNGDSYNFGPLENDEGVIADVISTKKIMQGNLRCGLEIVTSFFTFNVFLDKNSKMLNFKTDWQNEEKNHLIQAKFTLKEKIIKTLSEDMNELIERNFDSEYDIRKHLPKEKGIEAKTNTAPMQRFVWTNGFGIITNGITQYEIFQNTIAIPLLRATGLISNPKNSSRTTPAGPPIEVDDLQCLGKNSADFYVFEGEKDLYKPLINQVFKQIII